MTDQVRHLPGARVVALALILGLLATAAQAWIRPRQPDSGMAASIVLPDGRLDLNTAGEAQLDLLPGVGPALAQRIVEYRRQHGPFMSIDEVTEVPGIGPRTLERIRPLVINDGRRSVDP